MNANILDFIFNHTPLLYLTQSLWRDEAFSVLLAERGALEIIKLTAQDFNPPLYYLLLHFWMKMLGQSEILVRMLSFLFHLLLVYVGFKFAQKIFNSTLLRCYVATLLLFNPMLLYYAFEARMYSLLALLATLSMYHFYQKSWGWHLLFTTLGLYTHPFMIFVVLAQLVHLILTSGLVVRTIKLLSIPLTLSLPWFLVTLTQLKRAGQFWIDPVNFKLVGSSLGNLFVGFEGNPPYLWNLTKIWSLIILIFVFKTAGFNHKRKWFHLNKIKRPILLFVLWVFLPLLLTLSISFLKPIYINRYLIFVTVGEIFLVIMGVSRVENEKLRRLLVVCLLTFFAYFNLWIAPFHQKTNFKKTMTEINQLTTKDDLILANSSLSFLQVSFYARNRSLCFLLNQEGEELPAYVGRVLIPQEKILTKLPRYPQRAFLVYKDGSYEIVYNL